MNQEQLELAVNCVPLIMELASKGINGLKGLSVKQKEKREESAIKIGEVYNNYLKKSSEKYSKIKTILYKSEPKFIYEFFETPYLVYGNSSEKIVKLEKVDNILSITKYAIISGRAGIGKTTLMKHLFINAIASKKYIPIFIELKQLNSNECVDSIENIVQKIFNSFNCNIDNDNLELAFSIGNLLFLFDGYDELSFDKQCEFKKILDTFMDKYDNNAYVMSSRPNNEFVDFNRFTIFKAISFEKEQSISLIRKIDYDKDLKERFIKELDKSLYEKHRSFASNPLLLTIMLMTYENYAEIPSKIHLFYECAFDTLFSKHDATKSGYKREFKCKISKDIFRKVFSYFCCCSYMKQQYEFSSEELRSLINRSFDKYGIDNVSCDDYVYDLENSICVLYLDGVTYSFFHRSFQEYFTAVFFKDLTDEQLLKCVEKIVGNRSYYDDNVIDMFYDMSKERFEQVVSLYYLKKVDELMPDDYRNKFYYWLNNLFSEICVEDSDVFDSLEYEEDFEFDSDEVLVAAFRQPCDSLLMFAYKIVGMYIAKNSISIKCDDLKLINIIKEKCNSDNESSEFRTQPSLTMDEILDDEDLKELLNNSWIGGKLDFAIKLKEIIKKSNDIDDIF